MTAHDLRDTRTKHRLTADEFLLLDNAGAFGDRRTELLDGEIFYMSPKHRPHARMMGEMYFALRIAIETGGLEPGVLTDISVRLTEHNVPEPDLVITDAAEGEGILPLAAAKLVIEIADSTLPIDLGRKAELYAAAGIAEYWVIDLTGERLHQLWSPGEDGYTARREAAPGERVEAVTIEGLAVTVPKQWRPPLSFPRKREGRTA